MTVLDNPAWEALLGAQAPLGEVHGLAGRFQADVAPFHAFADPADRQAWADMATLVAPGGEFLAPVGPETVPPGWEMLDKGEGVQMAGDDVYATADPEAVVLTSADIPDMLELVRRTNPGPFLPRTIELGAYVGIRRDGALVSMAGERLRPPGWTEISAVCTDPAYRGQGLATRMVASIIAGIRSREEVPFLHVRAANTAAINLYLSMGFTLRREVIFGMYRRSADPRLTLT